MSQAKNDIIDLLVIGAGPYGLAAGALAQARGLSFQIVGEPMSLWRNHMPEGMILRSTPSWHFDPLQEHTLVAYLKTRGQTADETDLITRQEFLDYADWFVAMKKLEIERTQVTSLVKKGQIFTASCAEGSVILARNVLVAVGYQNFVNVPPEVSAKIAPQWLSHTFDWKTFSELKGKSCLIIGGRQSAYETAALVAEQVPGVQIYVSHRKDVPSFTQSTWDFVDDHVVSTLKNPAWFRELTESEQHAIGAQYYGEGRLKLEPWLGTRIEQQKDLGVLGLFPGSEVAESHELPSGRLSVSLSSGQTLVVDRVILATGYRVDVSRIPFLDSATVLGHLKIRNGFPALSPSAESSVPGLYFAGLAATQDFGLIFGFVKGAPVGAELVVRGILASNPSS